MDYQFWGEMLLCATLLGIAIGIALFVEKFQE